MSAPATGDRQIVLDTETTGLETADGHRIIEIGCVEVRNRRLTGNDFWHYLNPDREIDIGASEVHGIYTADLVDKPRFGDIADQLADYLAGAELIIHNAAFDVGFLDHEFGMLDAPREPLDAWCTVTDTLAMARQMRPGQRNSLDALCKHYEIDNSGRERHGALLDAQLLAEVYLAMTGGQTAISLATDGGDSAQRVVRRLFPEATDRPRVIRAGDDERTAHEARLTQIESSSGTRLAWPD